VLIIKDSYPNMSNNKSMIKLNPKWPISEIKVNLDFFDIRTQQMILIEK